MTAEPEVAFVLGTRPEIIKLAPVIDACERLGVPADVIYTGQHYSDALSELFFERLDLSVPEHDLAVGSGPHPRQTGEMIEKVERVLERERPSVALVQGDTNSTLAGGLAASKLGVPVGHVEAGLRSFDREMPEEVNRVLVDHASDLLFPPTEAAAENLRREGIAEEQFTVTGNTIVDAVDRHLEPALEDDGVLDELGLDDGEFVLLTAHREENVDDPDRFADLLAGVDRFATRAGYEVVYPMHPRARDRVREFGLAVPGSIRPVDPVDFLAFLRLERAAAVVFTDSGGAQEESCILGTPCVTLRDNTERPETVSVGANVVAGTDPASVAAAAREMHGRPGDWPNPYGDGTAATRIVEAIRPELDAAATGGVARG